MRQALLPGMRRSDHSKYKRQTEEVLLRQMPLGLLEAQVKSYYSKINRKREWGARNKKDIKNQKKIIT